MAIIKSIKSILSFVLMYVSMGIRYLAIKTDAHPAGKTGVIHCVDTDQIIIRFYAVYFKKDIGISQIVLDMEQWHNLADSINKYLDDNE